LVYQFGPDSLQKISILAVWGFAWFGVLFSIYLTFLEPFVIGSTCAWCLSSAIVITLILWVSTGPALQSMDFIDHEDEVLDFETLADSEENIQFAEEISNPSPGDSQPDTEMK
jgi:hypothetical protein